MTGGKRKHDNLVPEEERSNAKELKREEPTSGEDLSTTLCKEVRPLIDLIDRLRGFDLDGDLSLPAVAVIGDQSAGKSSVLEAISGVQLPRGTGIVTRCPLEMRMKHAKKPGVWEGRISYKDAQDKKCKVIIESPENVGETVCQAQNNMTSHNKGISRDLITLDVTSSDVPDLTLIDLPGIARNAVKGQPADIEKQIKDLIRHYIKQRETIILVVLQSNIDIATCEAIKMAREFDNSGLRTLGVLTKPDLIDKGGENEVLKILSNDEHHLSKGYIIVKCRGQAAVKEGQSLKEALQEETDFFTTHSHFSALGPTQWGIGTLSKRLTRELKRHIKEVLPHLKKDVQTKLMTTKRKLNRLGDDPPRTNSEKRTKALMMVQHFNTVFDTCIVNGQGVNDKDVPITVRQIYCNIRKCFEELNRKATEYAPDVTDPEVRKEIEEKMRVARGKEFINFGGRFELVESYVKENIQRMTEPALTCFKQVSEITGTALKDLATVSFPTFPGLEERAKSVVAKVRIQIQKDGKEDIEKYFKMEDIIYAQDSTYSSQLSTTSVARRSSCERDSLKTAAFGFQTASPIKTFGTTSVARSQKYIKSTMMTTGLSFGTPAGTLESVSPDKEQEGFITDYNATDNALKSLAAYYKVASRRLCDVVPMIIQYHVFRKQHECLQQKLLSMAADEATLVHIEEDEDVAAERLQCKKRLERLQLAEQELDKVN